YTHPKIIHRRPVAAHLSRCPDAKMLDLATVPVQWQKEFCENAAAAFEQKRPTYHSSAQERIAYLQKIQTDNGRQFIAKDFKKFILVSGMTPSEHRPAMPDRTENRTLAQIAQRRVHPAGNAASAGGCAPAGGSVCGTLQRCPLNSAI